MKYQRITILIATVLVLVISGGAFADEIWLKNGDHIAGTVVKLESDKLTLKTSYAGDISIDWGEVSNMRTDAPLKVVFSDGTSVIGVVTAGNDGNISIKTTPIEAPFIIELVQVKVINPPPPGPAVKLKGRINIGVSATEGNTDSKAYYGDGELVARTLTNRFTLGGRYNRIESKGDTTVDNQTGYIKYDHFITEKWYFLSTATGTRDHFKDLNLRTALGLGMGYQFFETEKTNLSVEAGASYVNEDFIVAADKNFTAGRWAFNFDHFIYKEYTQFFHTHVGLISLEDSSDITLQSQTGLRFKIYKGFNVTAQLNYDWDNSPPPGTDNSDKTYIFTLGYQF